MKINRSANSRRISSLTGIVLAVLLSVSQIAESQEHDARLILKAMSDYISNQQTIELTFDSAIEVITPQLEKIQFTNSGGALLSRPDRLYAHRKAGHAEVSLFYDGKTVSVFGEETNSYAQFDGPATVDQLFEALRAGHGIALPGADLLVSQSYDILIADVMEAKYIGRAIIDGRECEHLAFRNFDTDWQLWIETGNNPVPRKLVITSKTVNGAPQYSIRIKDWKTSIQPAADRFKFTPPVGAKLLSPDALMELDELPQDASAGGMQ